MRCFTKHGLSYVFFLKTPEFSMERAGNITPLPAAQTSEHSLSRGEDRSQILIWPNSCFVCLFLISSAFSEDSRSSEFWAGVTVHVLPSVHGGAEGKPHRTVQFQAVITSQGVNTGRI